MGAHLANILAAEGHQVDVTTRRELKPRDGITFIQGNAYNNDFVENLLDKTNYDVLVDFMVYRSEYFKDVICNRCSKVGQFVFLSSARVYADSNDIITEESPRWLDVCTDEEYLKTDEYALAKAREEDALINSRFSNWTIIRPYITYSETRLQLGPMEKEEWLYRHLHGRTIVFSKDIASKYTTLTYGRDVSRGIASIIGQKKAYGEVFHITQPQATTWGELMEVYLNVLEKREGIRPKFLMTDKSLNLRYPDMQWQVRMDRQLDRRFDNSKIGQFIDVGTFYNPIEGLTKCLNTFLDCPDIKRNSWFYEVIKDRLCCERAKMPEFDTKKDYLKYLLCRYLMPESKL